MTHSRGTLQRGNQRFGRAGGSPMVPNLCVQPGCSLGPKLLPARTRQCGTHIPLPPACPLPTVCLYCLAQLGTEGMLGWRYWCQGGAHLLQLSTRYMWLLHPTSCVGISFTHYTPWQSPPKRLSSFCRTELTQEAGDWGLRSSHMGKGDRKNPSSNNCTQRTSREVSWSCFQKNPWMLWIFSCAPGDISEQFVFPNCWALLIWKSDFFTISVFVDPKNHKTFSKLDISAY